MRVKQTRKKKTSHTYTQEKRTTLAKPRAIWTFVISHNFWFLQLCHFEHDIGQKASFESITTKLSTEKKTIPNVHRIFEIILTVDTTYTTKNDFCWLIQEKGKKKPTPNTTANEQKWRFLLVDLIGFHAFLATIATTMVIYYHCLGHKAPEYCVTATTHQSIDCAEQRHYKNYVNGSLSIHFEIYNKYNRLQGQSILN